MVLEDPDACQRRCREMLGPHPVSAPQLLSAGRTQARSRKSTVGPAAGVTRQRMRLGWGEVCREKGM